MINAGIAGKAGLTGQKAPSTIRCIKIGPSVAWAPFQECSSESSDCTKVSHTIPYRNIADRGQKPRNINDLLSNIERQIGNYVRHFPTTVQDQRKKGALRHIIMILHLSVFSVRKHRAPKNFACNSLSSNFNERRKPRHLNGAASSLEGVEAELHSTFSNNPPRSAPKGAL